jgi:hypothetical protein
LEISGCDREGGGVAAPARRAQGGATDPASEPKEVPPSPPDEPEEVPPPLPQEGEAAEAAPAQGGAVARGAPACSKSRLFGCLFLSEDALRGLKGEKQTVLHSNRPGPAPSLATMVSLPGSPLSVGQATVIFFNTGF